ncbi:Gamma-aminobutyric acid type B receptor subunit 2 [Triplophysa tibetana]|uniref:Gamma-aminobutyric acid type B receptor subunit 2 n=1 Tax=Triplophysa tibetana TaxID=1572043 RepID=A0A5A9N351_9TELE|nr:Gamma-aminobutyric acid type B receptor subunit 2 [Triplophysa tibetana]
MVYWWNLLNVLAFWGLSQGLSCYCLVRHQLPVLWIMPLGGEPGRGNITAEVLPAVQLALHHLSEQPPPLGNYEVQFHLTDSKCNDAKALKAFLDATFYGPKPLMVFGGVCPSVTSTIAQSLEAWNLVQLSFAVTATSLANKRRFPNFFRMIPSDSAVNLALVRLLRQYGWSRVGTLTQNVQKFTEVQKDLCGHLEVANIQLVAAESFSKATCEGVQKLKENDVRIVIAYIDVSLAAEVLCCVYNLSMYGLKYQWILPDWTQDSWLTITGINNCPPNNILTAMEGSISAGFQTLSSRHIRGISGRTPQEYEREYENKQQLMRLGASKFHGFAYDGTWVIAKVLTRVMETVRYRERYSNHRNFTVTDQEMSEMILEAIEKINFFGVTGQVRFLKGERVAIVQFAQYQDGKAVIIGIYRTMTDELEITSPVQFQGAEPTKDRTHVYRQRKCISIFLYSIITCLTVLGILTACGLLVFNVKIRNHWSISMSSPFLNSLIVLGALLSYFCIFFLGLDGSYISDQALEASCSVQIWLLSIGCTAVFGTMFAKTWRIHALLKIDKIEKRIAMVYVPTLLVLFLLLFDLSLLICLQILDPLRRTVKEYRIQPDPHGRDFSIQPFSEHCENTYMGFWIAAFYSFKGILLLSTCFLAWTTCHVNAPSVNDIRGIRISVFVSGPVILIGIYAPMLFQDQPNVQFCIIALVIITCCLSTLCMLFVPKILIIGMGPTSFSRRHLTQWDREIEPEREEHCKEEDDMKQRNFGALDYVTDIKHNIFATLDIALSNNLRLRRRITKLDSELEYLTRRLNESRPNRLDNPVVGISVHEAGKNKCLTLPERSSRSRLEDINSPEHIQRRLSLQLPILHHAYLPSIGGVDSSPVDSTHDIRKKDSMPKTGELVLPKP